MKYYKGEWGLIINTRPRTKSDWQFLLMMNEAGSPVNCTIGYSEECSWLFHLFFFGKRFHRSGNKNA